MKKTKQILTVTVAVLIFAAIVFVIYRQISLRHPRADIYSFAGEVQQVQLSRQNGQMQLGITLVGSNESGIPTGVANGDTKIYRMTPGGIKGANFDEIKPGVKAVFYATQPISAQNFPITKIEIHE